MSNRKYLYRIRKLKTKPWIKFWLLKEKIKPEEGVLSEILTGTSFTLENSLDRLFNKFDLKGNTLQDGEPSPDSPISIQNVSGSNNIKVQNKNLLDATNYKESNNYYYSDNLISSSEAMIMSFRDKDTSVDISGCYIGFIDDYEGIGNPVQYRWVINNGEIQENKSNLSVINNTTLCKQWFVYPKTALSTLLARYDIQIELGSTATDYIAHAEQNLPINLASKNLLDTSFFTNGYINSSGNHVNESITTDFNNYIKVIAGQDYTFSANTTMRTFRLIYYDSSFNFVSRSSLAANKTNQTFTIPSGISYVICECSYKDNTTMTAEVISGLDLQFEQGSTATDYEPYYNYELSKIETAGDYFFKENDKWYIHKELDKIIFDGSSDENWNYSGSLALFYINSIVDTAKLNGEYLCNYFTKISVTDTIQNGETRYSNAANPLLQFKNTDYSTVTTFKEWLSTHNTEVLYELATPTNTEITETSLINELEAILQARSYNNQTNISQTNEDLPFIIDLQYWMKEGA